MVYKIFKVAIGASIVLVLILILLVNTRLYYSQDIKIIGKDTINFDLVKQLRGLKTSLDNNADVEMQRIYPEGFVFMNALYGLAWCHFIKRVNNRSEYFVEGEAEIQKAWTKINSIQGRASFDEDLSLPFGAFYTGWSTYLLGNKFKLKSIKERDTTEVSYFKRQCKTIAVALTANVYPVSYRGSAWPADGVLCAAALALHDKLYTPLYSDIIAEWIEEVKSQLDESGLIPHAIDPANGKVLESARGSSQSLMLLFLKEIDSEFAHAQFKIYKEKYLDTKAGLAGVREYPKAHNGNGDIDSGPVILQMGAAATIVGMQTLTLYKENKIGMRIRNAIEAFGFPTNKNGGKKYLLGFLPMADAFIAWGDSTRPISNNENHFTVFHLYSTGFASLLILLLWIVAKPIKPKF